MKMKHSHRVQAKIEAFCHHRNLCQPIEGSMLIAVMDSANGIEKSHKGFLVQVGRERQLEINVRIGVRVLDKLLEC